MTLSEGTRITLNETTYQISAYLGHGAVADSYLATLGSGTQTVVIRLQKDGLARETIQEQGMLREVEVLERLNRLEDPGWPAPSAGLYMRLQRAQETRSTRHIIALLDSGFDGQRPFVIQEPAPGAFQPLPIKSVNDERRMLMVAQAIAGVIMLCHDNNLTLKDFAPEGGKLNRVRIEWDEQKPTSVDLKIIDWNVTGSASSELKAEDLFRFGGHFYTMLFRTQLLLEEGKPPADLSYGNRRWDQITVGSRYILQQLIYRRYQNARDLYTDIRWWVETLSLKDADALERQAWQVATRPDQQLAVADLALRLLPQGEEYQRFERIADQAREDQEKMSLLVLDSGIVNLRTGLYRKAVEEFNRILDDSSYLPADLTRHGRIYRNVAQAALMIREAGIANPTADPSWREVSDAADLLRRRQWRAALYRLEPLISRFNGRIDTGPLDRLSYPAYAFMADTQLNEELQKISLPRDLPALLRHNPMPTATDTPDKALEELRVISEQATDEPELRALYHAEQRRLAQLKDTLGHYDRAADHARKAEQLLERASEQQEDTNRLASYRSIEAEAERALAELNQINTLGPDYLVSEELQQQAQQYYQQIQARRQELEASTEAAAQSRRVLEDMHGLMQAGNYVQARDQARQAFRLAPALHIAQQWRDLSEMGYNLAQQAQDTLVLSRKQIQDGLLDVAHATLKALLRMDGQPLRLDAFNVPFRLPGKGNAQQLMDLIARIEETEAQVRELQRRHEYVLVEAALTGLIKRLDEYGLTLTEVQQITLDQAQAAQRRLFEARERLRVIRQDTASAEQGFPGWLHELLALLGDHHSAAAVELRDEMALFSRQLVEQQPDLTSAITMAQQTLAALPKTAETIALEHNLKLLRQGQALNDDLQIPPDAVLPAWLESPDWHSRFAGIADTLEALEAEQHKPEAIKRAYAYWQEQTSHLTARWVDQIYARATAFAEQRSFQQALEEAQAGWIGIPVRMRDQLTFQVHSKLDSLLQALQQRVASDQICHQALLDLNEGHLSIQEAATYVAKTALPEHTKVYTNDIKHVQTALRQAAGHAQALESAHLVIGKPAIDDMLRRAHEIDRLIPSLVKLLPGQLIDTSLTNLREKLVDRSREIARRLCLELHHYGPLPGPDRNQLISHYNAARQLALMGDPKLAEIIEPSRAALDRTIANLVACAEQERRRFEGAEGVAELNIVTQNLEQINWLNEHLDQRQPGALDDNFPGFNSAVLRSWAETIEALLAFEQQAHNRDPNSEPKVQARLLEQELRQLQQRLNHLRTHDWPMLFQQTWADDTPLARLEAEITLLQEMARTATMLEADRAQQRLHTGIRRIASRSFSATQATPHWLLAADWHRMYNLLEQQRQTFVQALKELVSELLGQPYPYSRDRLSELISTLPEQWVDLMSTTIGANIAQRLDGLQSSGVRPGAIRSAGALYWMIVAQATQPWAQQKRNGAGTIWADMHQTATERQRAYERPWQRWLIALFLVIGLLAGVGAGWFLAFWFGG